MSGRRYGLSRLLKSNGVFKPNPSESRRLNFGALDANPDPADAFDVDLHLDSRRATTNPTGTVNGTVVTSDGKPAADQKVRIRHVVSRPPVGKSLLKLAAPESLTVATVSTDKEGKFSQALAPGDYWAEAGSRTLGYAKERFTIKVREATDVKLTLTKN